MPTTYENDDFINPGVVNPHPVGAEPIEPIGAEHAVSPAVGSELPQSLHMAFGTIHEESAGSEVQAVHSEPIDSQTVNSNLINSEPPGQEMVHSQQGSSEPANSELASSERMHSHPGSGELVDSQSAVYLDPEYPESLGSELTNLQPDDRTEPDDSEPVVDQMRSDQASEEPVSMELAGREPLDSEMVHPLHANPGVTYSKAVGGEAADPDHVSSEPVDADIQSDPTVPENVHFERAKFEQVHSQMADSEADGSELVESQTVASEPEVHEHSFLSNPVSDKSQPISAELRSEATNVEYDTTGHPMSQSGNMDIENAQTSGNAEFMTTERMFTDTMGLEQDHSQPVGSNLEYSHHYSSELDHSHPLAIDYSQSLNSEYVHSQPVGSELVHMQAGSSELVLSHGLNYEPVGLQPTELELVDSQYANSELVVSEPVDPEETRPNKRRKKKSIVWEHFTIESVGNGCRRACCKVCKQSFAYSTGSKVAGTSHLKRHIAKGTCPVILRQQERNQSTPYVPKSGATDTGASADPPKRRYRSSSSPYLIFDQDKCRHEIARMIIMHDYPLHIVEHPGFVSFVQNLQPRFSMVSVDTVRGDCVATYLMEKQNLQKLINGLPGRICLTLDMWTARHSTGYVFLTGQFIDNDWKLHRRLLNVVMEPFPETETALSHAVATCLSYWGLENKLSSITVDQPLSDGARDNLRSLLWWKNPQSLNGQLLVANCIARTLSSMALEVLGVGQAAVRKVRASVKYVKTSDSHEEKFLELKQQLQVPSEKTLVLDNLTRWDTTYRMLVAACELKEVFSCFDMSDTEYKDAPSLEEWKQVESICTQLKLLYETAKLLTGKTSPPPNIFFHEVWKIQLDMARTAASDDPFVRSLAKPMQDKFNRYWEDCCLFLAIAVAMDPRFKMKLVEFSFTKIFGEHAPSYIRAVEEGIHEIFHECEKHSTLPLTTAYAEDGNNALVKMEQQRGGNFLSSNGLMDFDMYIMETTSQLSKSELDQYLEESLLPRVQDFDVLGWWKMNRMKYPALSKMARDILTSPLSTLGPDSVFDTVRREMDTYRSSLRPETLEALVCAKDWLRSEASPEVPSAAIVKVEV